MISAPDFPVLEGVALASRTTMGVGGSAAFYVEADSEHLLREALRWAAAERLAVVVLGGGSNIVVSDTGFDGLVIRIATQGLDAFVDRNGRACVRASAGEALDRVVETCVDQGWAGLECLSGIPGTVGAAPVQNVGAYGQEVGSSIREVVAMTRSDLRTVHLDRAACGFAYRDSAFKRELGPELIITTVILGLELGGGATALYPELSRALAATDREPPSLRQVRQAVLDLRRSKSMLGEAIDPNGRSAGSFFTNPVVTTEAADRIESAARASGSCPSMPRFAVSGGVKLSAAWLIERAGFNKGFVLGNAGISSRHALALVNRGEATAHEIFELAGSIRRKVSDRFGVRLAYEPVFWGLGANERSVLGLE